MLCFTGVKILFHETLETDMKQEIKLTVRESETEFNNSLGAMRKIKTLIGREKNKLDQRKQSE